MGITEANYPTGEHCWKKIIDKGIEWDEKGMKFKVLKRLAGIRKARKDGVR